jgi:hypothetical protein
MQMAESRAELLVREWSEVGELAGLQVVAPEDLVGCLGGKRQHYVPKRTCCTSCCAQDHISYTVEGFSFDKTKHGGKQYSPTQSIHQSFLVSLTEAIYSGLRMSSSSFHEHFPSIVRLGLGHVFESY